MSIDVISVNSRDRNCDLVEEVQVKTVESDDGVILGSDDTSSKGPQISSDIALFEIHHENVSSVVASVSTEYEEAIVELIYVP